jgi:hypothetical protein
MNVLPEPPQATRAERERAMRPCGMQGRARAEVSMHVIEPQRASGVGTQTND